tara:strand:+ start:8457 stop:8813 length:357 start_codon:yes stop_codon:yes gene_type:complete
MTDTLNGNVQEYPNRDGFRNFYWAPYIIADWEEVWCALWDCGLKWEWQNSDRYARRVGDVYNLFAVHNDAYRLDMAFPLPGIEAIKRIREWLLDFHIDNPKATLATNLIREWIKNYVE